MQGLSLYYRLFATPVSASGSRISKSPFARLSFMLDKTLVLIINLHSKKLDDHIVSLTWLIYSKNIERLKKFRTRYLNILHQHQYKTKHRNDRNHFFQMIKSFLLLQNGLFYK